MVKKNPEFGTSPNELFRHYPTLIWFHHEVGLPPDLLMELLCIVGIVLATLCANNILLISPAFGAIWSCYLSIYLVGQTFLSFQWDLLMLEVGFLAIWLAPPMDIVWTNFEPPAAIIWAIRFVLFKLMLMAGSVKIQSACPTWLGLTALDFHYATQCLPLPTSWFAHQLPVSINIMINKLKYCYELTISTFI